MTATLAEPQAEFIRELLKTGRWNDESEIVRYGIELVRREVERESLAPVSEAECAACYERMSEEEREADRALSQGSLAAQQKAA